MELYVHIPFCIKKCDYCDFLSGPKPPQVQKAYMEALGREIRLRGKECKVPITTVFIGGGTPSAIPPEWIGQMMEEIRKSFCLTENAEISLESNPGTLTKKHLDRYRQAGINRLSIGLQSGDNEELKRLGRIHTWETFLTNYQAARQAGFSNINIDLMSALPGQTKESWQRTLEKVILLKPEHISAYSLILEEGTVFFQRYSQHPELLPGEEADREMYHLTKTLLQEAGYHRYEISNYSLPGYSCRHNTGYWQRVPYLGLGLGAASLQQETRFHNTTDLSVYLELFSSEQSSWDLQTSVEDWTPLSAADRMEEFMFLGLRMTEGVKEEEFYKVFRKSMTEVYGSVLEKLQKEGLLQKTEQGYCLTEFGLDVSNRVFGEFLLDT